MKASRRKCAALALAAAGMLAAASSSSSAETAVTTTSRPVRLLRRWDETVKAPNGRDYVRHVELVFDYAKGFAQERYSWGGDGRIDGTRDIKQSQPSPSAEEVAEAFALVRQDAELGRILARKNGVLEGGFILEEGRSRRCGPGSRCLQIQILSPDREGLVRWTVVDLVKREIAYPVYVPGARP
jgi:hypothetical protein